MIADGQDTEQNEVCSEDHSVQFSYDPAKCTALWSTQEDISRRQLETQVCNLQVWQHIPVILALQRGVVVMEDGKFEASVVYKERLSHKI